MNRQENQIGKKEINLKQYVVDAFTDHVFSGNQAAVRVTRNWLPDDLMQNIAKENLFSEAAFNERAGRTSCYRDRTVR